MGGGLKREYDVRDTHFESYVKARRLFQKKIGKVEIIFQTDSQNFKGQFSTQDTLEDVYAFVREHVVRPFLLLRAPIPGERNKVILGRISNTLYDLEISSGRVVIVNF